MQEIAGGAGRAVALRKGEAVRLVNSFGSQVVDTWALAAGDLGEYLSVEHTRRMLFNLFPRQGDTLYSNRRQPMLLLEEDTSPGKHDMLFACCDKWLYKHYGSPPGHRNCRDNFIEAMFELGHDALIVPNPLNLWMNIPVTDSEKIGMEPPLSRPGDHVLLRALMDAIVVFSACPMDVTPINGPDRTPKAVHFEVVGARSL
ncbi:MAG TPA: urea carboxylase-associated family protein [Stellaceae bacterium]|nr:urea carboxylase-associated family protein [Stellaceae bacterium]